jgi:hypothetical protein
MTSDDFALFRKMFNSFNEDGTPNFESGFFKTLPEGAATLVFGQLPMRAGDPSL